ncbi:hypothetical protein ACF0H5_015437 [Mactra antiquata]
MVDKMAERNHKFFDDETKSNFTNHVMESFRYIFVQRGLLTEEKSKRLYVTRHTKEESKPRRSFVANLRFKIGESDAPSSQDEIHFDGFHDLENSRTMFQGHIKPKLELSYDKYSNSRPNSYNNDSLLSNQEPKDNLPCFDKLSSHENVGHASDSVDCQGASASAGSEIPEPSLIKESFCSTIDVDKNLKLVIIFSNKEIQGNNNNSVQVKSEKCKKKSNKKSNESYTPYTYEKRIPYGAEEQQIDMIVLKNDELQVEEKFVLQIKNEKSYMEEIYFRGQSGAFGVKQTESDGQQGGSNTFVRYIQCGKAIFKIDFKDFYVYEIVGIVKDSKSEASQWPWLNSSGKPDFPPLNDKVSYEDLIKSIQSGEDRDEFFNIFKHLITGDFCGFTSSNKSVTQLCLVLCFSEVIRNYNCLEWNKLLSDYSDDIVTAKDLREVLKLHPMNAKGTFIKRRTGYNGHTSAAEKKISGYKNILSELRDKRTNRSSVCAEMPIENLKRWEQSSGASQE